MLRILVLVLLLSFGTLSRAADYTGIYQDSRQPGLYYSIHHKGGDILIAAFFTIAFKGVQIQMSTEVGNYVPNRMDMWELYQGVVTDASAQLSGEFIYGACSVDMNLAFDASGNFVTFTETAVRTTPAGSAQNVPCTQRSLSSFRANRVF